jgi:zinc protease
MVASMTGLVRRALSGFAALSIVALLHAAPATAAVDVQRVVSPGGVEAWLVQDPTAPLISVSVAFRGGSALDPQGKEGLAEMVSGLLDEGAGDLDSPAFQRRLADLALDFGFEASLDSFGGSLRTLTEHREAAFDLLGLALTEPRFDTAAVERIRGQLLAMIARDANDPDAIADRIWWRITYPDHPYGRPSGGTSASIRAITVADLEDFVARRIARDNLIVSVVGDIDAATLARLLDRAFGRLPATSAPVTIPAATIASPGAVVVAERDMPQSVMMFGHAGIDRHDPDFYAAYVMNYVLGGGGFSSRLTDEVREKRGLAYSVGSYLVALDHAALIQGSVGTQNARVAETLDIVRQEWTRMRDEGPTQQELDDAKTYLVGSYPLRMTSTGSLARILTAIQLEGFPIDYMEHRNGYIEAVTLDDVKRVAQRLLDPAALTVVVVGKPDGITPTQDPPTDAM